MNEKIEVILSNCDRIEELREGISDHAHDLDALLSEKDATIDNLKHDVLAALPISESERDDDVPSVVKLVILNMQARIAELEGQASPVNRLELGSFVSKCHKGATNPYYGVIEEIHRPVPSNARIITFGGTRIWSPFLDRAKAYRIQAVRKGVSFASDIMPDGTNACSVQFQMKPDGTVCIIFRAKGQVGTSARQAMGAIRLVAGDSRRLHTELGFNTKGNADGHVALLVDGVEAIRVNGLELLSVDPANREIEVVETCYCTKIPGDAYNIGHAETTIADENVVAVWQ